MSSLLALANSSEFEVSPLHLAFQILNFLIVVAYIYFLIAAIIAVLQKGRGSEIPLWIIAIFLVPLIGIRSLS